MDIMDTVKKHIDYCGDESFVFFDSEIAEVIKCSDNYTDEEINQALGQYVYVKEHLGRSGISKESILNDDHPSELFMQSLDTSAYNAAMCIKSFFYINILAIVWFVMVSAKALPFIERIICLKQISGRICVENYSI